MGIFELRTNWQEDLFWCKAFLWGEGCYCPELTIDGCTKPIQYGQDCCMESSCGLRPNGKIIGCFPHPTEGATLRVVRWRSLASRKPFYTVNELSLIHI